MSALFSSELNFRNAQVWMPWRKVIR